MNPAYPPIGTVRDVVQRALAEDLGPLGDITSALLPPGATGRATLVPRTTGILAGRLAATEVFAQVDRELQVEWQADDGDRVVSDTPLATVEGPLASMLTAERTVLNFLSHLSGVATLTRRYADLAREASGGRTGIRDTRKTTPGLRALEKAAVRAGGGMNHRASLSDGLLLKDNHLAGVGIDVAVKAARRTWPGRSIQVECDNVAQLEQALAARAELVLLDNMSPDEVSFCVVMAAGRCLVEVSGGVSLDTVASYAATGVDFVSVGALTHSAPVLDIGLDMIFGDGPAHDAGAA